jgi:hypothetical protein
MTDTGVRTANRNDIDNDQLSQACRRPAASAFKGLWCRKLRDGEGGGSIVVFDSRACVSGLMTVLSCCVPAAAQRLSHCCLVNNIILISHIQPPSHTTFFFIAVLVIK